MICDYCGEPILPGERADNIGSDFHVECMFRGVSGSVAHIRKECSCYGGTSDGDAPGLTKRQGARAAFEAWRDGGFAA